MTHATGGHDGHATLRDDDELDALVDRLARDADSDEYVSPEMAPVIEAGGGVAEGFELSEEELIEHVTDAPLDATERILEDAPEVEPIPTGRSTARPITSGRPRSTRMRAGAPSGRSPAWAVVAFPCPQGPDPSSGAIVRDAAPGIRWSRSDPRGSGPEEAVLSIMVGRASLAIVAVALARATGWPWPWP